MNLFNDSNTPCIGKGCPDFGDVQNDFDAITKPAVANLDGIRAFGTWTVSATYTAYCPPGMQGNAVTVTRTYTSQFGYWDALYGAILAATNAGRLALACSIPVNPTLTPPQTTYTTTNTIVLPCPSGTTGGPFTGTFTATSLVSQADSDSLAAAGAILNAQGQMNCVSSNSTVSGCVGIECTGTPTGGGGGGGGQIPQGKGGGGNQPVASPIINTTPDTTPKDPATPAPANGANCMPPVMGTIVPTLTYTPDGTITGLTLSALAASTTTKPQIIFRKYSISNPGTAIGESGFNTLTVNLSETPYTNQTTTGVYKKSDGTYVYVSSAGVFPITPIASGTNAGFVNFPNLQWFTDSNVTYPSPGQVQRSINITNAQVGDVYTAVAVNSCGWSNYASYTVVIPSGSGSLTITTPNNGDVWDATTHPINVSTSLSEGTTVTSMVATFANIGNTGTTTVHLTEGSDQVWEGVIDVTGYTDLENLAITVTAQLLHGTLTSTTSKAVSVVINNITAPTISITGTTPYNLSTTIVGTVTCYHLASITAVQFFTCDDATGANPVALTGASYQSGGHWNYDFSPPINNNLSRWFTAQATDSYGHISGYATPIQLTQAHTPTTAPSLTISGPTSGVVGTAITISSGIIAYDLATVSDAELWSADVSGTPISVLSNYHFSAPTTSGTATFSYTPITSGTLYFVVKATDNFGNTGVSPKLTFGAFTILLSTLPANFVDLLNLTATVNGTTATALSFYTGSTLIGAATYNSTTSTWNYAWTKATVSSNTSITIFATATIGGSTYNSASQTTVQYPPVNLLGLGLFNTGVTGSGALIALGTTDSHWTGAPWYAGAHSSASRTLGWGYGYNPALNFYVSAAQLATIPDGGITMTFQVTFFHNYGTDPASNESAHACLNGTSFAVTNTVHINAGFGGGTSNVITATIPKSLLIPNATNTINFPRSGYTWLTSFWVEFTNI